MRYSEIKKILDENLDNDGNINKNNFFQMLIQINEYDEMRNISNYNLTTEVEDFVALNTADFKDI